MSTPSLAAADPAARPRGGISHLGTLLGLAWKLRLRGYTRSWQQALGLGATLIFFILPVGALLGVGTAFGYVMLPPEAATQLLFAVLLVLYVAWAVLPLLQYTVNEGLDVTKLVIYPVTRTEQMLTLVLATLFDLTGLIILAAFVGIVVGWHVNPVAIAITAVALALAYVHIVTLSQLLLAALMGMLRSRRYRDLSIIFFVLVSTACSFTGQVISRVAGAADPSALAGLQIDRYVWWTPPGMAAEAISRANAGDYLIAGGWLVGLAALVPVALWAWAVVLDRGITTAETAGAAGGRRRARRREQPVREQPGAAVPVASGAGAHAGAASATTPATTRSSWLPGPVAAIAGKDLRYFWRDPQMKASMLSSLLVLVFIFLPYFTGRSGRSDTAISPFQPEQVFFAPLPALLIALNFSINAFGYERAGAQTLFLLPVRPLSIFWGKNLAVGTIAGSVAVAATLGVAALTGGWGYVPIALALALAAILVVMGCGNVTSVLLPFRVREMRMGQARFASENGCLRSILSMGVLLLMLVLLSPLGLATAVPLLLGHPEWLALALPAGILYGLLLYQLATRLIAPQVHRRAPDVLAVVARDV
jgi:hypothetical protein